MICIAMLYLSTNIFDQLIYGYTFRADFEYGRYRIWSMFYDSMTNNLLWGIGQGRVTEYFSDQVHNAWLELLVENGIFALLSMMSLLFIVIYKAIALINKLIMNGDSRAYLLMGGTCGMVSMIVMLASVSLITEIYVWFQIGFLLSMIYVFNRQ
jgi:O-antigen ligase